MTGGFAKSLFLHAFNRSPWQESEKKTASYWPKLEKLFIQKKCTYLDYVLTTRLLRNHTSVPCEAAILICHVIMAAREGHLCVKILENNVFPSVDQVWRQEDRLALMADEAMTLNELMIRGFSCIPESLMTELSAQSSDISFSTPLCRHQNAIYLQRHWTHETVFLEYFNKHRISTLRIEMDPDKVDASIGELYRKGYVLEEQAQAIRKACLNGLSIVTGGPGTGKTYTAGQMIKVIWENLDEEQKKNFEIVVAAPTGKAVANVQKNLSKIISELNESPKWMARTLHGILGIKGRSGASKNEIVRLTADLVIVDESSMIDMQLMSQLFEALKIGSRVVFLGDRHQLASVEAGSVFADLIHLAMMNKDSFIAMTELKICLRAELKAIIDFAAIVNQGKADQALDFLRHHAQDGIKQVPLDLEKRVSYQEFLRSIKGYFRSYINQDMHPQDILELFQSVRILSPMRKGPFGSDELNALIWEHFSAIHYREGWLAIPIMIVTNDYRKDLFNGETGTLMRKLPLKGLCLDDYAVFPSRQGDEVRKIPAHLLPKYEYAYCLSVHKSQGSEFDHIILVMPQGSDVFGREVFYTAITRAKKQIEMYGSDAVIYKTILERGIRLSGVIQRLQRHNP